MIAHLPMYISIIFILTTVATLALFYWSMKNASIESTRKNAFKIIVGFVDLVAIANGAFLARCVISNPDFMPPKIFLLGVLPTLVTIVLLFITTKGKAFIDSLPLKNITYLNVVRIPVELVLWWLFLHQAIPELMTFEGRNFDILAGNHRAMDCLCWLCQR
jgi:hypothetical protein